jgi:hypothetical protein
MRRLAIRPHGFVSVHGDHAGGEVLTKPFTFTGTCLRLNFSTSAAGSLRIAVCDEQAKPLEGFTAADASPLYGDKLDEVVRWGERLDLSGLHGRPVRLRVELRDADVFAFRMAET